MKVKDMVEILNKLPQDMDIEECKPICSIVKTETKTINNTGYNSFIGDVGMMCDLLTLSKDEFLKKYFYITKLEYDITRDLYYSNKQYYANELYNRMCEIDINKAMINTQILEKEIGLMNKQKG